MNQQPAGSSPLRPYQQAAAMAAVPILRSTGGFYVQHPAGAGKSLTAIVIARLLKAAHIVIICPVVAQGVWRYQWLKWWPTCADEFPEGALEIHSYDGLDNAEAKRIAASRPDLVIFDEGQYIKSPDADRTRRCKVIAEGAKHKLYLSGTPAHNIFDWYAPYRVIAPGESIFQQTYSQFKKDVGVLGGPNGNWPMKDKAGNLKVKAHMYDMLNQVIARYTHFAPNALDDIPEPIESVIPFELDPKETQIYERMRDLLRAQLPNDTEASAEIVLTKLMRLAQIAAGHVTNDAGETIVFGDSRLRSVMELIDQRPDQKIVIACRFRKDIERIRDELNKRGRACAIITGDTPEKHRTMFVQWFQAEGEYAGGKVKRTPENAVMLLQYRAGGVAITLTEARTLILYTLEPSVIAWHQIIGRVWRIGQTRTVEVLIPQAEDTQDEVALSALKSGADQVNIARILLNQLHGA